MRLYYSKGSITRIFLNIILFMRVYKDKKPNGKTNTQKRRFFRLVLVFNWNIR